MNEGRCTARLTRRYAVSVEEVWHALTDPDSQDRWLAPPPGVTVVGSETERVLELDWSPPGEPPSVVRIELHAEGDRTLLVLEHSRIDAAIGMRYLGDWSRALDRFESQLDQRKETS